MILQAHDRNWRITYAREAVRVRQALGSNLTAIHHIGGTAIDGLSAQPVIDVLAVVADLGRIDLAGAMLAALGYISLGEHGVAGRRLFHKTDSNGALTHKLFIYDFRSARVKRMLAWQALLLENPVLLREFDALKQRVAGDAAADETLYEREKQTFIEAHLPAFG
jgi:GrpB-like predicted nucleotidyltransferase (UPF0157 family)